MGLLLSILTARSPLVDAGVTLRLVHPSQTATDRPSMDEIMAVLRGLNEKPGETGG